MKCLICKKEKRGGRKTYNDADFKACRGKCSEVLYKCGVYAPDENGKTQLYMSNSKECVEKVKGLPVTIYKKKKAN